MCIRDSKLERALITEYEETVRQILASIGKDQLAAASEIAALRDMVRGYEDVKLLNVQQYRARLAELKRSVTQHAHRSH